MLNIKGKIISFKKSEMAKLRFFLKEKYHEEVIIVEIGKNVSNYIQNKIQH